MSNFHSKQHLTDELTVKALVALAKEQSVPYSKIKKIFSEGDEEIAKSFWIMLRKISPKHKYNSVYFCPACKKFDLEQQGPKIPW
jgi:hypothetical protein